MALRLGIPSQLFTQPLIEGLKRRHSPEIQLIHEPSASLAVKLRERVLDAAFLSPIDYARDSAVYRIVPGVGVSTKGMSGFCALAFREQRRSIRTVAIDPSFSSEIVLTHIVLAEKYETAPLFIPSAVSFDAALQKADAVLVVGDAAYDVESYPTKIDLVDEWTDMTDLPFVHGMWVVLEEKLAPPPRQLFADTALEGLSAIRSIQNERAYIDRFSYELTDDSTSALSEFFRMAYYHGILEEVPEIKFAESHSSN